VEKNRCDETEKETRALSRERKTREANKAAVHHAERDCATPSVK
jgi:hypothetical protein